MSWLATIRCGARAVAAAPLRTRIVVGALMLLCATMLPFGRGALHDWRKSHDADYAREADAGSMWAPITVDSGYLFRTAPGLDFFSIYDAGSRVLAGLDPYSGNDALGVHRMRVPYAVEFRYPAITAWWLGAPLNLLPPWTAYYCWVLAGYVVLVLNFLLCVGRMQERLQATDYRLQGKPFASENLHDGIPPEACSLQPVACSLLALVWFGWFPLVAEWHMGQFNLLMASLLFQFGDRLLEQRRGACVPWMFACLLKVYPIAMAPLLWCWGRRRGVVVTAVVLVLGVVGGSWMGAPRGSAGMFETGMQGRIISGLACPYAGAQGLQALANAVVWKLQGRSFAVPEHFTPPPALQDPVVWIVAVMVIAYGIMLLVVLSRARGAVSLPALGIFWLLWFVAFRDVWEHHTLLLQALLALLITRGMIGGRATLVCWLAAGAPSLWWLWQRTGYQGNALTETVGLLYFVQRPIAILTLMVLLGRMTRVKSTAAR